MTGAGTPCLGSATSAWNCLLQLGAWLVTIMLCSFGACMHAMYVPGFDPRRRALRACCPLHTTHSYYSVLTTTGRQGRREDLTALPSFFSPQHPSPFSCWAARPREMIGLKPLFCRIEMIIDVTSIQRLESLVVS